MTQTRTAKVLLVDDRADNLLALEAILQGLPVEAVPVGSGEEALKRLMQQDFAAILLDANMPGMDGFETAGHIKSRQRTRHIPIIFLTAADYDPHLAFRGYQAGAVDYLTKPFDPWVLRSKIAVFVDLWSMHAELSDLAAECLALRAGVDNALQVLTGEHPDPAQAAAILGDVRGRTAGSGTPARPGAW
ncbi:MAG TPA: response regulator [Pseudonocardiaceae bacterium]